MTVFLKNKNLPNILTCARMALIPVVMVLIALGLDIPAGIVFVLASLTDFADGYLARKNDIVSNFGKFLDPVADKLLVMTSMIMLSGRPGSLLPAWLVCVILARDLLIDCLRMMAAKKGIVIAAGPLGKIKTTLQMLAVIALLFLPETLNIISLILIILMGLMTVISGADYLWRGRDVLKD